MTKKTCSIIIGAIIITSLIIYLLISNFNLKSLGTSFIMTDSLNKKNITNEAGIVATGPLKPATEQTPAPKKY